MATGDPIANFNDIIDVLNQIALGEPGMVSLNGQERPTLAKVFAEFLASQNVYQSIEDGLAATAGTGTSNRFFTVTTDAKNLDVRYRNDNGTAVEVGRLPSGEAITDLEGRVDDIGQSLVDDLRSSAGRELVYALTDALGRAAITVDTAGQADLPGGLAGIVHEMSEDGDSSLVWAMMDALGRAALAVHDDGAASVSGLKIQAADSGFPFVWADSQGRMSWAIDRQGRRVDFHVPIQAPEVDAPKRPLASLANVQTDYMMGTSYGQSLSIGTNAYPPVSTTQPYSNVMFASGVVPADPDSTSDPIDYSAFVPLIEQRDSGVHGETPVGGTLNGIVEHIVAQGGDADAWRYVGTAPGRGGTRISALVKGSANYGWMLDQWQAARDLAHAQGRSFSVSHVTWTQGEEDYDQDTSYADYLAYFLRMVDDIGQDAAEVSGQSFHPPVVTYQSGSNHGYGREHINVALAQWHASRDSPNVIMAAPVYPIPTNPDDVHLTADSSQLLGRYYSRALVYSLFENPGQKWRPLEPTSVIWSGQVIDITFHVPHGGLTLDTDLVTEAPNYGLDVFEGNDVADIIQSVEIVGADRVRVTLTRPAADGAVVSYARGRPGDPRSNGPYTGPRGNLRDTHGDVDQYVDSQGTTRYMHNWCVVFQYQLGSGAI